MTNSVRYVFILFLQPQAMSNSGVLTDKSEVFVFVPSYNHASFIERCLKSIIKQTLQPVKLLVIDDGSKDDSAQIIEQILNDCPFPCEFIVRENRGLCATLNEGFAQSFGDYFAYLGSDDVWLPSFLENRTSLLDKRTNAVLAYGNAILVDEKDCVLDCSAEWSLANYRDGDARPMLLEGVAPVSSTVVYRRSALAKFSWNQNSRLEDYELYLKLSSLGEFAFDSQILSLWRQHSYNTSKDMPLMLREVLAAQKRNITSLEVRAEQLEEIQQKVSFRYAQDFLQHGHKKEALRLAFSNLGGASTTPAILKFFLRLFVPMSLVNFRRKFLRQHLSTKYCRIIEN